MLKYLGLGGNSIKIDKSEILKEGLLKKESRIRKIWRERWTVVTYKYIVTYEKQGEYTSPTEAIDVSTIRTVKSDDNPLSYIFKVHTSDGIFSFEANDLNDKENWIGMIGKVIVLRSNKNVFIEE